jgi:hypothetical protein
MPNTGEQLKSMGSGDDSYSKGSIKNNLGTVHLKNYIYIRSLQNINSFSFKKLLVSQEKNITQLT